MGIFLGPLMHNSAARCALNINYAFTQIIKPRFEARYSRFRENYELAHCVGIDTSEILMVRGGVFSDRKADEFLKQIETNEVEYVVQETTPVSCINLGHGSIKEVLSNI